MHNKKIMVLFVCITLSVLYLSSSFTYGLVVTKVNKPVFRVTQDNDVYTLDLLANSETPLYPGLKVSTPFDIINDTDKKVKLLGINFENFNLTDSYTSAIIPRSSDRYEHFLKEVYINFRYKDDTIYNGPISGLCDEGDFIFQRPIIFSRGAGSEFIIELSMTDSAENDTQSIKSDFNLTFNFREHYVAPPPGPPVDPPVDPPVNPPVDDPDEPIKPDEPDTPEPPKEEPKDTDDPVDDPEDTPTDDSSTDEPYPDDEDEPVVNTEDSHEDPIEVKDTLIQTGAFFDNKILKGISIIFILSGLYMILKKKR